MVEQAPSLPYKIHTNFELGLMLRGLKPLAFFSRSLSHEYPLLERYLRMFDRHVEQAHFIRSIREHSLGPDHEAIYYALPGEEWRIDEMHALHGKASRWVESDERREGELLGYEDWQNDIWIERFGHTRFSR